MVGSVDKQVRRESLERELRTVRSAIRTFREAAETAQDQSVMLQLERAEEKEVQLLEALADRFHSHRSLDDRVSRRIFDRCKGIRKMTTYHTQGGGR